MASEKELALVNSLRAESVLDNGRPSFLREWEPVRFLGKGSFGEVYLIRRGGERCALKIVAMDDEFIEHYAAEIDALERIKNERHAVRIYEYAIVNIDRGPYIEKYMLIRMNLLNKLPKVMSEDQVIEMGIQLGDILTKCHGGTPKIFHCDIKPENILVSDDGIYKLSDFGAAKISDKTHNSSGFRGTPMYMSPEMSEYRGYDHRSDLYSLGVTMYTLLNNGLPPFSDGTNSAQAIRMRFDGKKLPQIEGVSAGMMKILRKLCAAEPDKRYRNAQELTRDLRALADVRKKQREAEEAARRRAEEEARRRAAEEEAKRRAAEQAAKERARKAEQPQSDVYAQTAAFGQRTVQPVSGQKRRPLGIIATAAALVAAIVCGAVFIPKLSPNSETNDTNTVQSDKTNTIVELNTNVSVGDHVYFGSYPQTEDGQVQPIEWRVLDIEDGSALMISEYLLDAHSFDQYDNVWKNSDLRTWLNLDFLNKALSSSEQKRLGTVEGDKVTCLSSYEAGKYFSSNNDRIARKTAYLDEKSDTGWWWLRSPGSGMDLAAYVNFSGLIYNDGQSVTNNDVYVRPVVLVSLSGEALRTKQDTQQEEQNTQQTSDLPDFSSVSVGDHVTFGSYPQTEDGQVQPIEWRVLDIEDDGVLMISEYLLDAKPYNEKWIDNITWEKCTLRKWLNSEFYNTAFNENEQKKIIKAHNTNTDNATYGTKGSNDTDDHVFCLSYDEAIKYFSSDSDRIAQKTAYVDNNSSKAIWWLRSPGSSQYRALDVSAAGNIGEKGYPIFVTEENGCVCCVRPAILVSLSA